jgi:hypothetical protein
LIVVVIVAAWAVFLVPQWLHRRAEAAAHLADRVPEAASPTDTVDVDLDADPVDPPEGLAPARPGRVGRRLLVRPTTTQKHQGPAWLRGRPWRRGGQGPSMVRSAAARRRRVLAVLAAATLVAALAVAVSAALGGPAPGWVVAVPGLLMVGYLVLLALVHPAAASAAAPAVRRLSPLEASPPARAAVAGPAAAQPSTHAVLADDPTDPEVELGEAEGTWTPVPVPVPTYVTAARAPRTVRTIDLSNPGSWTSSTASGEATSAPMRAGASAVADDVADDASAQAATLAHRRAVGD